MDKSSTLTVPSLLISAVVFDVPQSDSMMDKSSALTWPSPFKSPVLVVVVEPPLKKDSRLGALPVSPIRGRPSISSAVRKAEKWLTGLPLGVGTLDPGAIEGAANMLGIGVSSSHKNISAVSPDLYWALSKNCGRKLLTQVSALAMTSLTVLQECMFSQLVGRIIEYDGRLPLFKSLQKSVRVLS